MDIGLTQILSITVIGIGATVVMDISSLILMPVFGSPSAGYCLVGRWLSHMLDGTFTHTNIVAAAHKRFECAVGWLAHYTLGVLYAFVLVAIVSKTWIVRPTLLPTIVFGIVSLVVPFLLMQPSFGFGIAASKTPAPTRARIKALLAHTAYGLGLFFSAIPVSYFLRVHG